MLAAAHAPTLGLHPLDGYRNHLLNQLGVVRLGILVCNSGFITVPPGYSKM